MRIFPENSPNFMFSIVPLYIVSANRLFFLQGKYGPSLDTVKIREGLLRALSLDDLHTTALLAYDDHHQQHQGHTDVAGQLVGNHIRSNAAHFSFRSTLTCAQTVSKCSQKTASTPSKMLVRSPEISMKPSPHLSECSLPSKFE